MDLSLWSIKTKNWSVDSFKTHHLNELLHFSPRYSQLWHWSADTPFWQLSIDHNMDDHKNVHY